MATGPLYLLLWTLLRPYTAGLRVVARTEPGSAGAGRLFSASNLSKGGYFKPDSGREAEYRDSDGNHVQAKAGEALLLAAQPGISYSEHNLSKVKPLTRMQLWLDACPERENALVQKIPLLAAQQQLLASPDGEQNSLQLRQQVWVHHITLEKGESLNFQLHGPRAYLQSIHGTFHAMTHNEEREALTCGDGAFIRDEPNITLVADTPLRALLVDLPV